MALQWLFNTTTQKNIGNCKDDNQKNADTPSSVIWPAQNDSFRITSATENPNGSFCNLLYFEPSDRQITCDVLDDMNTTCVLAKGNHTLTLTVYAGIMVACRLCLNNFLSLLDGTAMQYADRYNGSYAMCIIFSSLGCLSASYLAGLLIVDPEDSSSKMKFLSLL